MTSPVASDARALGPDRPKTEDPEPAAAVLSGRRYPELINDDEKLLENSFVVPDAALADVSPALRAG